MSDTSQKVEATISDTATKLKENQAENIDAPENNGEHVGGESNPSRMVPVAESIRYRKRAQSAEQELATLQATLTDSQAELTQLRDAVSRMERQQKIDALLSDADAVDMEVARLLTEAAVEVMDEPDVALAIDELRRTKPYLFSRQRVETGAMGLRGRATSLPAEEAASVAATTGDRRDLLRYLRLRRNGHPQSA